MAFGGNQFYFSFEMQPTAADALNTCQSHVTEAGDTGFQPVEIRSLQELEFLGDVTRALVHSGERSRTVGYFIGNPVESNHTNATDK